MELTSISQPRAVIVVVFIVVVSSMRPCTAAVVTTPDVSCTAGTFMAGETAHVICYFSKDVSAEKVHLYVGWKPFHGSDVSEDRLACFKTSEEVFDCTVSKGFRFNYVISDRLTLEIPKVTHSFSGRYTCHQIPKSTGKSTSCDLIVNKTEEAGENRPKVNETETLIYVITPIAVIVTVLLAITITVFFIRRKKQPRER
ncbi:uncharacterized protein [Littorina saxatilis]|uniref:uncharacterized protein n=1 Tax=Littorina saxatilis TaxID=31220 RepID=UPI0038B5F9B0